MTGAFTLIAGIAGYFAFHAAGEYALSKVSRRNQGRLMNSMLESVFGLFLILEAASLLVGFFGLLFLLAD